MKFEKDQYLKEMKSMVIKAIERINNENPNFEIFTASIWTDPNSAASSIGFDSKKNSDRIIQESNEWNKKYYDKYLAEGDLEQAKLFESSETRSCNPSDFELRDFVEINNNTIQINWEEISNGNCWNDLEPALKEVGEFAFTNIEKLKTHQDFEVSVNGKLDWYEFVWKNKK